MKFNSVLTAFASNSRQFSRVTVLVLVSVLVPCCIGSVVYALNGYAVGSWGTTTDTQGFNLGPISDRSCFLSGVSGNLNLGAQPGFGCATRAEPSTAQLAVSEFEPKHYRLVAHGGACENQADQKVWHNNPVNAQATCFLNTAGKTGGTWTSNDNRPKKIAELSTGRAVARRRCFLTSVVAVSGTWNSSSRFARVRKVTTTDSTHPTTGWYIEANLPTAVDNSYASISAGCVNFSFTASITSGTTPVSQVTKTFTLTSGGGIKACALMGIQGAFKVNAWNDGVVMNPPPNLDGNWTLTVTAGKSATWACVK